ncbi:hypothetical protein PTKIN_Ptkin13bG0140800 [Pterospermum kingtungense]
MDLREQRQLQLQPESRQRIIRKIMDTLKRHMPVHGQEGLNEVRMIAVRFEEKIYAIANSQSYVKAHKHHTVYCFDSLLIMMYPYPAFRLFEENLYEDAFAGEPASDCLYWSKKKKGDGSLIAVRTNIPCLESSAQVNQWLSIACE